MASSRASLRRDNERVFANLVLTNPIEATAPVPAVLNQSLTDSILENPSDYNLIITRFSIPGDTVPVFKFQAQPFPNTNVDLGIYTVVVKYNGNATAPIPLTFIPQTTTPPLISTFSAAQPVQNPHDPYYDVFSFVAFGEMITAAMRAALVAGVGFLPAGADAYMVFNALTGLYSFIGTANLHNSNDPLDPLNVQFYFNTPLATFFSGIRFIQNGYNTANGQDEYFFFDNQLNNTAATNPVVIPAGYGYIINSEFEFDFSLESLSRILLSSSSFGGPLTQNEVTQGGNTYQNLITDFVPAATASIGEFRGRFQFFAASEFIRRDLTSTRPLTNLNLNFQWVSRFEVDPHQIYLNPGDSLSVQVIFEKKDIGRYGGIPEVRPPGVGAGRDRFEPRWR